MTQKDRTGQEGKHQVTFENSHKIPVIRLEYQFQEDIQPRFSMHALGCIKNTTNRNIKMGLTYTLRNNIINPLCNIEVNGIQ